jgi:hypothetical protein
MGEWRRLNAEVHLAVARVHAEDKRAARAFSTLKTHHRPALFAGVLAGMGVFLWWRRREVATGPSHHPSPTWLPWLVGALPALMHHVISPVVPPAWRRWVTHPLSLSATVALVRRAVLATVARRPGRH